MLEEVAENLKAELGTAVTREGEMNIRAPIHSREAPVVAITVHS